MWKLRPIAIGILALSLVLPARAAAAGSSLGPSARVKAYPANDYKPKAGRRTTRRLREQCPILRPCRTPSTGPRTNPAHPSPAGRRRRPVPARTCRPPPCSASSTSRASRRPTTARPTRARRPTRPARSGRPTTSSSSTQGRGLRPLELGLGGFARPRRIHRPAPATTSSTRRSSGISRPAAGSTLAVDVDPRERNFLAFGWSKTADPSDLVGGWCRFVVSTDIGGRSGLDDYPKLGHDNSRMIFGANAFRGNTFFTAHIWSVPKPANGDTSCTAPALPRLRLARQARSERPTATSSSLRCPPTRRQLGRRIHRGGRRAAARREPEPDHGLAPGRHRLVPDARCRTGT